ALLANLASPDPAGGPGTAELGGVGDGGRPECDMAAMTPLEIWPVFGIRIETPRLVLRPVQGDTIFQLADLAAQGIHDPALMPFMVAWTDLEAPEMQRSS